MRVKRKALVSSDNKGTYFGRFLVDGESPVAPHPQTKALGQESSLHQGPGRHRSVDLRGLVFELIDEIYPPLVCPACFTTSHGRNEADQHLKEKHHGLKLFKCVSRHCEQAYASRGGLRYHLEHNHDIAAESVKPPPNKKPEMKKPTRTRSVPIPQNKTKRPELSEELGNRLDEMYPLNVCPACKKEFKKKTHVVHHLVEDHHGQEPYKCIVNDCKRTKAYATREGLIYHLINYHE